MPDKDFDPLFTAVKPINSPFHGLSVADLPSDGRD
ncbi:MAG: hypothetical protein ABI882_06675 [Acidobacteriota bacterium]